MTLTRRRLLGSIGIMIVTALTVEGLVSLTTGQGLLRRVPTLFDPDLGTVPELPTDREQALAAAGNPGPYWLHPDPMVGLVLRPGAEVYVADRAVTTNELGLRRRPRPEPPPEAVRIVVVGSSIPFGWGLEPHETLAYQLEDHLTDVLRSSPPVACYTVAIPRWSHRNAVHFLLDHWAELDPDIVLYMPMDNDLADTLIVNGAGARKSWPDPSSPHRFTPVDPIHGKRMWLLAAAAERRSGRRPEPSRSGTPALTSDLSPESRRRIDESTASILRLARHVERHDRRLALLSYQESSTYLWLLLERLQEAELEIPTVPLFRTVKRGFKLPGNPHPKAATQGVMALWTARAILDFGWLGPADSSELAAAPRAYEKARAPLRSPAEIRRLAESRRQAARERLQSEVRFDTGRGVQQVYGGLSPGGYGASGLLLMLKPAGPRLVVRLEGLDIPAVYPLEVEVRVDGSTVGALRVPMGETVERIFGIPPRGPSAPPAMEVHLTPRHWGVVREQGILQVAAFRPRRIASEP